MLDWAAVKNIGAEREKNQNVENVENHAKREENQKRNLVENAKKVAVKNIKCVKKKIIFRNN